MTTKEFRTLEEGDTIKRVDSLQSYVVLANNNIQGVVVQSTKVADNPSEWDLVSKKK